MKKKLLKITETGLYKTRDGRRVFISNIANNFCCAGLIEGQLEIQTWNTDGINIVYGKSNYDIVSKWEE